VELIIYIMMGWACVLGFFRLFRSIPLLSFILLLAGGLAYTLGTLWYRNKNRRGTHIVWHAFVLLGAMFHWFSVWFLS
jgi:hemolysin III